MGSKLEDIEFKKRNFAPGPGNYAPEKQFSIPAMKFGSGSRSSLEDKGAGKRPGPGAYTANQFYVAKTSPKFGFGSSTRQGGSPKLNVPGPGNYKPKTYTGEGQRYSMASVLTYDPKKKEQKFVPGPGNYQPTDMSSAKKEPAYRIGTEQRVDLEFKKK